MNPIFEKVIKDHYGQKTAESYDRMAYDFFWSYSEILKAGAFSVAYHLARIHQDKSEISILDLGAGTGNFCCEVLKEIKNFEKIQGCEGLLKKVKVFLKDQSPDMLAVAQAKIVQQFGIEPQIVQANLNDKMDETQIYDVVISSFAVHHLDLEGKQNLFNQIKQNLSAKGLFVLVDRIKTEEESEAQKNLTAVSSRFFSTVEDTADLKLFNGSIQQQFDDDGDQPSTEAEHRELLTKAGFSHVKLIYYSGPTAAWAAHT